ncbi:inositol monophosphatase family protein [Cohnella silvisoli]|uniref:Inositol-1-monophosphatase n=1 Tax=Cohnella silvisoli TaxID=2873699 RepID=A0ABV1L0I1_9BACL|nr:inositol monophosphatase family protein [Cohnella silvisoli]MCD9025082.1 inositol monophosphatase [Cohnella silvisoli]
MNENQKVEDTLLQDATRYAREVGEQIVSFMKKPLRIQEKKNVSDLVTEVDLLSERILQERITSDYPEHWMMSEETDGSLRNAHEAFLLPQTGYGWIIDPIDGTTNFIHGFPHFAISIGIVKDEQLVCGVVYNPITNELYCARRGHGAYLNGRLIQVDSESQLEHALLATGFQADDWRPNSPVIEQIGRFTGKSRSVRIVGAASLDLCLVASGKLTGFWHEGLYPWDVAAGVLIIQEAGGRVTNREGSPFRLSDNSLVASNGSIHQTLLSFL